MTKNWPSLCATTCLVLFGAGCASQPAAPTVTECEPEIIVQERIVEVPADLTTPQPCPTVPDHGDVAHLLDWMENCAISARLANDQLDAIRQLQH